MKKISLVIFLIGLCTSLFAQPANDECEFAIDLGVVPICPVIDTFTNVAATASNPFSNPTSNIPTCFNGNQPSTDVWFSFMVPSAGGITDFEIQVNGINGPNGSILQPQIALYRGACALDELQELACATAMSGETNVDLAINGLTPGITYYLRIEDWSASAASNTGDFELCIKEPDIIFNMGTTNFTDACSGVLFDSGGPDNNYLNNENLTFTICPDVFTNCISLEIADYQIENNYDFLTFYAGEDTNAPQMGSLTSSGSDISFQAGTNCVTIQFSSDFSVTQGGFELSWQCDQEACETTFIPCEETFNIFDLPFITNGTTTCGAGNDVQTGPCIPDEDLLAGEDVVYTYTAFGEECIAIMITGADLNTGLSIYDACPESATDCLAFAQNTNTDTLFIPNLELTSFEQIFIVVSNENCTDYNISVETVDCPVIAPARPVCEDALLLNNCGELPDLFGVSQSSLANPVYYQEGMNDGCWPGVGEAHYTWLFFQAQTDGDFGFIAQNVNELEASNINIQVWGPITNFDLMCEYIESNQPIRSTGALATNSTLTGLTNINPINNDLVADVCEGEGGDGFVSTLEVQEGEIYLVFLNDFDGNIGNAGLFLDFSPTSAGVIDGLPEDTPLTSPTYHLIGDAFYEPQNYDFSCIHLTAAETSQLSCVWAADLVDFSEPFSQNITVYLGDNNSGADGICMVYHQSIMGADACGISGGGIGASEIDHSFIIEFDTWQNTNFNDPFQDHIAVNINGDMSNPIGGPAIMPNLEDGQEHEVTFNWNPATNTYEIFFDGVLQITGVFDIIQNCFQGLNTAYCGFTGSTGGAFNLQYACTGDNVYPTNSIDSVFIEICEGQSYIINGEEQTEVGIYEEVFPALNGCDSIIVTELSIIPATLDTLAVLICEGESYFAGGAAQTEAGFYQDTLSSIQGCDSIIVTNLGFIESTSQTFEITLCEGESYFAAGAAQTTNGIYIDSLLSVQACDSIIISDLNFIMPTIDSLFVQLCEGETYFAEGQEQTASGIYIDTLVSVQACDSIIETELEFIITDAIIELPEDLKCEEGFCTTLDASNSTTGDNVTYTWTVDGDGQIEEGAATLSPIICGAATYFLEVTNVVNGETCISIDSVIVIEDPSSTCSYAIPNVFTPNGDNMNDVFQLVQNGDDFEVLSLIIFNRWGQKVHTASNNMHAWDGTYNGNPAPSDVYIFQMEIRDVANQEIIIERGDLTLLR